MFHFIIALLIGSNCSSAYNMGLFNFFFVIQKNCTQEKTLVFIIDKIFFSQNVFIRRGTLRHFVERKGILELFFLSSHAAASMKLWLVVVFF